MSLRRVVAVAGVFLLLGFGLGYLSGLRQTPSASTQQTKAVAIDKAKPVGFMLPGVQAVSDAPLFGPLMAKAQPVVQNVLTNLKSGTGPYEVPYPRTTDPGDWLLLEYPQGTYLQVKGGNRVPADLVQLRVEPGEQMVLYASDQNGRKWLRFEAQVEAHTFEAYVVEAKKLVASQTGG